jgi:PAS domain-containing protein
LLHEAVPLLRGLCSNALIGVYVIQDDRFVFVNERLASLFGYSAQELCAGMGPQHLTAEATGLGTRAADRRLSRCKAAITAFVACARMARGWMSRFSVSVPALLVGPPSSAC